MNKQNKTLFTFEDYQNNKDKVEEIKKLSKPKTPKSYFLSQFLYHGVSQKYNYKDEPLIDGHTYDEFLLNPSYQTYYFDHLRAEPMFVVAQDIWELIAFEKNLIEHNYLSEDNDYFNNIMHYLRFISIHEITEKKQQVMYQFFTAMYLERPNISSHWNFKNKLNKQYLDELIFSELNNGVRGFQFLIKHFEKNDLKNAVYYIDGLSLNIKEFLIAKFLMNKSNKKKTYNTLQDLIDLHLKLPVNLFSLWKIIQKNQIHYYKLRHLEKNELSLFIVSTDINNIPITTSVENMTKFYTMSRALNILINTTNKNKLEAPGLKDIPFNNFEEAVHHFFEDPFLKQHMPIFMAQKANKAQKKENKTRWSYFNLLLQLELESSLKDEKIIKKLKL